MTSQQMQKRYELFVQAYMCSFNKTYSAIKAGYSKSSAHNQGSRMMKNDEVKAMIEVEMKRLRERMSEKASEIFGRLWYQLEMIDDKIQRHEDALSAVEKLETKLIPHSKRLAELEKERDNLKLTAQTLDGRTIEQRDEKKALNNKIRNVEKNINQAKSSKKKIYAQMNRHQLFIIDAFAWEKIMTMRANILRDLFDRVGYKATDKVEMNIDGGVTIIDDIEAFIDD